MLITFKSHASGDVVMLGNNGKQMLSLLGKCPDDAQGIVTVEQLPVAIMALRQAIEADKANQTGNTGWPESDTATEPEAGSDSAIHLHQRALPLLELLERSNSDAVPVTWGV